MTDFDEDIIEPKSESESESESDYEVGYGKPPKDTQFQPGQSGNLSGRPKGSRNLKRALEAILDEDIRIKIDGHPETTTKLVAFLKSLYAQALNGNVQASKLLVKILETYPGLFNA
jgi:hypothetical protein